MVEAAQRAPKGRSRLPSPMRNKLEPRILPHQGWIQRNPPTSPPSITSLFFQAVTTCKAFPQAEHMDLIKCRSLTTLSCPNSLHCLCLSPLLHLLLLPLQPQPHSCILSDQYHFNISPQQNKWAQVCECGPVHSLQYTFTFWYTIQSLFMRVCTKGWARFFRPEDWIVFSFPRLLLKIWLTSTSSNGQSKPCMATS